MPNFVFLIFGLFLFFCGIGFIITEKNANYMLAGYNRLTEEEKKAFNLPEFIRKHKTFHLVFSITYTIVAHCIYYIYGITEASFWLATSPLIVYAYYIPIKKSPFKKDSRLPYVRNSVSFVLLCLAFYICFLFYETLQDNSLDIVKNEVHISGMYGIKIAVSEIKNVQLVSIPSLFYKLHGITTKKISKGFFKLDDGKEVLMYINKIGDKCILIERHQDKPVYYNSSELDESALLDKVEAYISSQHKE